MMLTSLGKKARIDLHMHSNRSDGAFAPQEVLRQCAAAGLDVIALTDHDLAPDVAPGVHVIDGHRLRVIAGAEVTGEVDGREFHLLVYFPGDVPEAFQSFCREQCVLRAARYTAARESLQLRGVPEADAAARRGDRALTRLHLAHALVEQGHAEHVGDAFGRFLSESHGHVPTLGLSLFDAIRFARQQGGVTSWAHPSVADAEAYLPALVDAGLQGVEALRPHLNSRDRGRLKRLARSNGAFLTGGSDWHGWHDARVGLFRLSLDDIGDFAETLQAA